MGRHLADRLTERDALLLFERLTEPGMDPAERRHLLGTASAEVRAILHELEDADRQAEGRFATRFFAADTRDAARPARVGVYRLAALIGVGGMGEVWRGERDDGLFDQAVAVKLIRRRVMGALAADRFADERRLLARLDHPGIARIIDGGVTPDGWPYLVMEHVDGMPIDAWSEEREASVGDRVALLVGAANAVQAAHAQLVAHADIKPDNLLVTPGAAVKLIDFGIAELLGQPSDMPLRPMTRQFASPERIAGGAPSVADDVYALGAVLTAIVPPAERDADLAAVIDRASAPLLDARYPTAQALAADLVRWQQRRPVLARPPRLTYRLHRLLQRHVRAAVATSGGLLLLGAALVMTISDHRAARQAQAAEAQRVRDLLGISRYVLFDLDGRLVRQPRSLLLRAALAARGQTYLDRLGNLPDATANTRIQAAEGWRRLAAIQDHPGVASLGHPVAALHSLARGQALVAAVPGGEARRLSGEIMLDTARVRLFALADVVGTASALAEAEQLLRQRSDSDPSRGRFLLLMAQLRSWQNRFAEEVRLARAAAAATPADDPREAALSRIAVAGVRGEGLFYGGRTAASLASYREERALAERAAARWPGDPSVRQALAHAAWDVGSTLLELGRAGEALTVLERGVDEIGALTQFDTNDDEATRMRNILEDNRAQALAALGRVREALPLYDAGVRRWETMWRQEPNLVRARDYAIALDTDGALHAGYGDVRRACRLFNHAASILTDAGARQPLAAFDMVETRGQIEDHRRRYCATAPAQRSASK